MQKGTGMKVRWLYTGSITLLFMMLVVGIPLFPDLLSAPVFRWFNTGMLIYLLLMLLPPLFAFLYVKERSNKKSEM